MPNNSLVPPTVQTNPAGWNQQHGQERAAGAVDDYAWMRDATDPALLAYLRAEREHYDRSTEHLSDLRDELFSEVERRLLPTDDSVSWKRGAFFYTMRSVTGSDYSQFVSRRNPADSWQVVLDEADLAAEPGGYVGIGVREPSPDGRVLAYSADTDGDEVFTLRFRDIATGRDLPDTAPRSYYGGAWTADSSSFFYTVHDDLYRPHQVWRHDIGTDSNHDVLVFEEPDARFDVIVRSSTSGRFVIISSDSRDTSEAWFTDGTDAPRLVKARTKGIEYAIDHAPAPSGEGEGDFLIVTNDGAQEFRLMRAPVVTPDLWAEVEAARPGERLGACHVLATHLVLELRRGGFPLLRVIDRGTGAEREVAADTDAGQITIYRDLDYAASEITVQTQSFTSPPAWYAIGLATGSRTLRKQLTVPGLDLGAYRTERRHVPAADGGLVPVTLAYRADTRLDGTAPCVMWGYGAYESCDDPEFDPAIFSLLDRGIVYAQTHPRGGGENGRAWWLDGRLEHKSNTFSDHLDVANWLADAIVEGARIATRGLSAGGLLQTRVMTLAPSRWAAVVAEVPFVDVIGSMSDPTIPLTVNEWDEWGDPRRPADFEWMAAYSPYEHLPASPRPPLLVTAAVNDPRVMVHEPTKYVAKMRATAEPGDEMLFRVELGAGAHAGPSGRYAHVRYEAEIYAWILSHLGVA